MSTKPLGKDIQNRVRLMDMQHGPTGLTIAQLKQAIKGFLSINQYPKYQPRDRQQERQTAYQPRQYRFRILNSRSVKTIFQRSANQSCTWQMYQLTHLLVQFQRRT